MPILSDFTVIQQDSAPGPVDFGAGTYQDPYTIGDVSTNPFSGSGRLEIYFGTGGVHNSPGLLTLMVRFLTDGSASVRINGFELGRLQATSSEDAATWRQQQFIIPTNVLNGANSDSANQLVIGRVNETGNPGPGNQYDDFQVRDIVCFFHQAA